MSGEHTQTVEGDAEAPRTSIDDHQRTFETFLNLIKWTVGVVALVLIGMAVFLL
ncbi:aa3-type cytochrome c oxidase subunit IV [Acuticoccus sp.]|uniref:aa3-type cytochrome c oxidase subunit IV n=1 Tax=Acuticoccus sp. TaxID=1904378 RepID=UPI003B52B033